MDRLTMTYSDNSYGASNNLPCGENSYEFKNLLIDKLGSYEDSEEKGRLVKLPCKVGETVWVVTDPFNVFGFASLLETPKIEVFECYVSSVELFCTGGRQYRITCRETNHFVEQYFSDLNFGKSVFLTKEEAEKRLLEIQKEGY